MIKAQYSDKPTIVNILSKAFDKNQSVSYIIKQDTSKELRIRGLMEYSFEVCYRFGEVYLSDDRKSCALILLPDKKKTTLTSIGWDVKFATKVIGLANVKKVLAREAKIKAFHPKEPFYYLWFIGTMPEDNNQGIGTKLLKEVIAEGLRQKRPVYLETSTLNNLPWYEKHGFKIFHVLDLSYKLHFLKLD